MKEPQDISYEEWKEAKSAKIREIKAMIYLNEPLGGKNYVQKPSKAERPYKKPKARLKPSWVDPRGNQKGFGND